MEHQSKRRPGPDVRTADGFTAAVKQIERLLFSVSYAILCNGDACADAVQAALLKAWENRTSLKDAAAFRSWMVQIVQNESRNYLHRKPALPLDIGAPDPAESPARMDVRRAVARLPEKTRLIAVLYYFERCPAREICALLHLPEGTVHSRLARAREQLRKELPDYERN